MKTVRDECLKHFVIFGERHVRHLLHEFVTHYYAERFHQGLGGKRHAGRERARAAGKHIGRPASSVDRDEVFRHREAGLSIRSIAKQVGVSKSVVHWVLSEENECP